MKNVNGGLTDKLTDEGRSVVTVMEGNLLQAVSMSTLMVNTTLSGSHNFTCRAELVVTPAPDIITGQNQATVSVIGEISVV